MTNANNTKLAKWHNRGNNAAKTSEDWLDAAHIAQMDAKGYKHKRRWLKRWNNKLYSAYMACIKRESAE